MPSSEEWKFEVDTKTNYRKMILSLAHRSFRLGFAFTPILFTNYFEIFFYLAVISDLMGLESSQENSLCLELTE